MANTNATLENEIKSWLEVILKKEKLNNLSVQILGNSEKGDGYLGDIVFVDASGTSEEGSTKVYNLVLKCSKRSESLRKQSPIKEVFFNEINVYTKLLPTFTQFQLEKGIEDYFNSVPKCYGSFTSENMEVIAFENLKAKGYFLWDKETPLPRSYIDMVINQYAKFHAISLALKDQQANTFQKLADEFTNVFKDFAQKFLAEELFGRSVDEIANLLKNDLDESSLIKWKNCKRQIASFFRESESVTGTKVMLHGDCWNNNFMYYKDNDLSTTPTNVAILDWQGTKFSSPIFDLSYFLFTCISEEDLKNLNTILQSYHKSLFDYVRRLGSNPETLSYSFDEFLKDWNSYSKYGLIMASLIFKIISTDKNEVVDIAQTAEQGKGFGETFSYKIKNTEYVKKRMIPIIHHAVKHNLI